MAKILIFDSGVGGLTIFNEISQKLSDHSLIFASDNAAYPYGTKSESDLIDRVNFIVGQLLENYHPDILVIACNSASTVVLPVLREEIDIPIVGVVPAIKPAATASKTGSIGVLATPATIKRKYTRELIEEFAVGCKVTLVGSSELVDMAEQYMNGTEPDFQHLTEIVSPFMDISVQPKIDTIVLACTHFPLLKQQLNKVFMANNASMNLIDSGAAIATRVADILDKSDGEGQHEASRKAVFSKKLVLGEQLTDYLKSLGISQIDFL